MKWTAGDLAKEIDARVEGDSSLEIAGVAAPERAGAKDLIYVDAAKHAERAAGSSANCVVAADGISLSGKTILRSSKAKAAFAQAAALLLERAPIATGIHATAIVAPLARIGANVGIGPYAVIGADGFGYAFDGEKYWKFPQAGLVEIADDVEIGANTTIDRGSLDDTRISQG